MRLNIYGNKKRFWRTFLFLYLFTAFLSPAVHSHEFWPDGGEKYHDLSLEGSISHNHAELLNGEWHSGNLFAGAASFTDLSTHDHNSDQHYHFLENQFVRSTRGGGGPEGHKIFVLQVVTSGPAFQKVSCEIPPQLSPVSPPTILEFVLVATNLPPPLV